jgi:hypothetical protein
LKETGESTIHYYWLKIVINFWNSILEYCDGHHGMMKDVALADLNMDRNRNDSWSKDVSDALEMLYS